MSEEIKQGATTSEYTVVKIVCAIAAGLGAVAVFVPHPLLQLVALGLGAACASYTGNTYIQGRTDIKLASLAKMPNAVTFREPPAL